MVPEMVTPRKESKSAARFASGNTEELEIPAHAE